MTAALAASGVARAQDADAEARQHFKAATGHYAVGEFTEAATEYEAAFKLHQDPALLFDAAQARRLGGDNQKALVLYRNFLHLYPNSPNVPTVREQIEKLEPIVAAEQKAKVAPPTTTVEPNGTPPATPPPATATTTTTPPANATAQNPPPPPSNEKPPLYKKWWLWTAVGAVVVVAVVVPIAVIESQPAWNNLPAQGPGAALTTTRALVEVRW